MQRRATLRLEALTDRIAPAAGALDLSFGGTNVFTAAVGSANRDTATGAAVQPDGKLVVAGYAYNGTNFDFALTRFNPDGTPDPFFGTLGKVTTTVGTANDTAAAVAVLADGKIVLAGSTNDGGSTAFALARYQPDGSPDPSFDGDGKLTTAIGGAVDQATSLAVQADGKLVVAGAANIGGAYDFALARYNADGSLDATFNADGKLTTPVGSGNDSANGVAVSADGRIVAVGSATNGANSAFALARFNADGSPDRTFHDRGKVLTDFGADDHTGGLAVQADGKIVLAGYTNRGGNADFALARYNPDGTSDSSFGGGVGRVTTDLNSASDFANAVVLQPDGRIVVAGYTFVGSTVDFALVRYNPDGNLDLSFGGGDGIVTTDFGSANDFASCITIQADGKIVAVGITDAGNFDFALARYDPDGSLDTSFGGTGRVTTNFGPSYIDEASGVAVQPDGKIVATGFTIGVNSDIALARYNPDGSLDLNFGGGDGEVITDISPSDSASAVAVQADGKIVIAGYASVGSSTDFAVVRYNPDGGLDATFDGDGKVVTDLFGSASDLAGSLAIQSDGKIVLAGRVSSGGSTRFALARYDPDGSLDVTFDGDGKLATPVGRSSAGAYGVAVQADGRIVAAGDAYNGTDYDFALIRVRGDNHTPQTTPATFQLTEDTVLRVTTPTYVQDVDGDTVTASVMVAPAHGQLALAADGSFAYTPDPDYAGPDSFLYKVTDPDGALDVGSVTLDVVDDAADRLEVVPSPGSATFTEPVTPPAVPVPLDPGVRVGSALEDTVTGATVRFTGGYVRGRDVLLLAPSGSIKGKFNATTGTLTLSGAARPADYQAALRNVQYVNRNLQPVDGWRTIAVQLKDAGGLGEPAVKMLRVAGTNSKPTVTLPGPALTYKARGPALAVAGGLAITDPDNSRLTGARVAITAGFAAAMDALGVTTRAGIVASYDATTGVLTLTGNARRADYVAVLRSLKFKTTAAAPAGKRTLSITVNDGQADSDPAARDVTVV